MRFTIIITIFVLFWIVLISRIYQVSIKSNYYYENLAKNRCERKYFIKPVRGEILDRKDRLLAVNKIGFSIKIEPHLKSTSRELIQTIESIVKEFPEYNSTKIIKHYKSKNSAYNHKFIPIIDFISYEDMIGAYPKLTINKLIKIESETKRYYPAGSMATHIVGYVARSNDKDNEKDPVVDKVGVVGRTGLERQYNDILQGKLGYRMVKVSATNEEVSELEKKEPIEDQNLVLNVDLELQKLVNRLFRDKNQSGVAVVMHVNGDILSAVSYPSYDPNLFVGGISGKDWKALIDDFNHPFTNKIVYGLYPPGSTIKMGMALAFAQSGKASLDANEYCKGYIRIGRNKHKFRCWSKWGHGSVPLRKAIRESCDVYFYNKSLQVGIDAMSKYLNSYGLGVKTGVDLPRERAGVIPSKAWKMKRFKQSWYRGETVIASIGQGYDLITPLQLARITAFLATKKLPTPHLAHKIVDKIVMPEYKEPDVNEYYLNIIRRGMYDVCNAPRGTARRAMSHLPIVAAGKTGTSQVVSIPQGEKRRMLESQMEYYSRSHAWFTSYAPFENPKFVVSVLVEHGGHGGSTSAPIAAEIYKWLYKKGYFKEEALSKFE
ncbi:Cell division protein FtsI [Peptidoglycan synthetase] [hydrothermal vent metagenome]|uniref:Cell division protein FtsI [Peptidoglycan synthetase] n=1 Tax=hydrothermal vent metagenome TaxID=652676 RepID=A0A1W1CP44_9ZZZZ